MTDEFEECSWSGLAKAFCSHCTGAKLGDEKDRGRLTTELLFDDQEGEQPDNDDIEFEILRTFPAQYSGFCTVDRAHKIKRGDIVAVVQRADNPMLPVKGVACRSCVSILPHAS
jgi:hypothetical protein